MTQGNEPTRSAPHNDTHVIAGSPNPGLPPSRDIYPYFGHRP